VRTAPEGRDSRFDELWLDLDARVASTLPPRDCGAKPHSGFAPLGDVELIPGSARVSERRWPTAR
jgi:hypothetical protein